MTIFWWHLYLNSVSGVMKNVSTADISKIISVYMQVEDFIASVA
jgi:hypothetical protein